MTSPLSISLKFIGHYASRVLPISVCLGLLFPPLTVFCKPLLIPALLVPLALSLVRIHTNQLIHSLFNWKTWLILSFWILLLRPVLTQLVFSLLPLPDTISAAAVIAACAPPVTACAALALFFRLNGALTVVVTVTTMLLVPITFPPLVLYLIGLQIDTNMWQLSLRLMLFMLIAFCLSALIRKGIGENRLKRLAVPLDGISVLCISIFIIGIMQGVTELLLQQPVFVLLTLAASTGLIASLYFISTIIFWRLGPGSAMAIGLVSGNCNLGLMYLVLADLAQLEILVFFAVGQIPMYCLPAILHPLIKRFLAGEDENFL